MTQYRLLDNIDWESLDGARVTLQVSPQYLIVAKRDGSIVVFAKSVQSRSKKVMEAIDLSYTEAPAHE